MVNVLRYDRAGVFFNLAFQVTCEDILLIVQVLLSTVELCLGCNMKSIVSEHICVEIQFADVFVKSIDLLS